VVRERQRDGEVGWSLDVTARDLQDAPRLADAGLFGRKGEAQRLELGHQFASA
jgi:hypothetical protein